MTEAMHDFALWLGNITGADLGDIVVEKSVAAHHTDSTLVDFPAAE